MIVLDVSDMILQGYFSLAQANFSTQNRTRYGQDYYDQRMLASRRVYASTIAVSASLAYYKSVGLVRMIGKDTALLRNTTMHQMI